MQKTKLTSELINNVIEIYNTKFGRILTDKEQEILSDKILNIVEFDILAYHPKYPNVPPLSTIALIYCICEYKKAYLASKEKRSDTLESLGKGFAKKQELYKKLQVMSHNKSLGKKERIEALFKKMLLIALKNKRYSKIGIFIAAQLYSQFPQYARYIKEFSSHSSKKEEILNIAEESLKYFEYSYLSSDKIINSLLILLYTKLTLIGIDEKKAFKFAKDIVLTFIDDSSIHTDKYRLSYLTDNEIYLAGLYKGLPIYQWYTGSKSSYYSDDDVRQFQRYTKIMQNEMQKTAFSRFISKALYKALAQNNPISLETALDTLASDVQITRGIMLSTHKNFARMPMRLADMLAPQIITPSSKVKSLFLAIYTIFADLKTIFTKK